MYHNSTDNIIPHSVIRQIKYLHPDDDHRDFGKLTIIVLFTVSESEYFGF